MLKKATITSCGIALCFLAVAHLASAQEPPSKTPAGPSKLPPGKLGEVITLGKEIVKNTGDHPLSKPYVGNALSCTSCHLDAGTHPAAATFLDTATAYPAWSPRENRVITLEDRVLNCFMRSMNGVRPPDGSQVSVAITTYITWLSSGEKIAMNPNAPLGPHHVPKLKIDINTANAVRGATLYEEHCAYCHGENGEGDEDNPPVWGDHSYNAGAGFARNEKLSAWLKVAMPLDDPILTEQQALDVAAYLNSKPRPEFTLENHLPPAEKLGEYNADLQKSDKIN